MKEISSKISASVFSEHKTQVKQAINKAVEDTLKRQKPTIERFIAEMSKWDIIVELENTNKPRGLYSWNTF